MLGESEWRLCKEGGITSERSQARGGTIHTLNVSTPIINFSNLCCTRCWNDPAIFGRDARDFVQVDGGGRVTPIYYLGSASGCCIAYLLIAASRNAKLPITPTQFNSCTEGLPKSRRVMYDPIRMTSMAYQWHPCFLNDEWRHWYLTSCHGSHRRLIHAIVPTICASTGGGFS